MYSNVIKFSDEVHPSLGYLTSKPYLEIEEVQLNENISFSTVCGEMTLDNQKLE